jgi:WD40 repeat protein
MTRILEIRQLTGHNHGVSSVAVTPNGKYVVSGSRNLANVLFPFVPQGDNAVRVWDLASGQEVQRFTGHEDWVNSVAVTPDGKYVVSGSGNVYLLPLILGRDNTVRLWDLASGQEVRRFTGHDGPVYSVAATPDGQYVVSGSNDKTVRLWELATGKEVRQFTGHERDVLSVAVTPDGKYIVSGSADKTVRLWELATGKEVRRFTGHENWVWSVAVAPDGKYVVSGSGPVFIVGDKTVRVWELATGKEVLRFTGHEDSVLSVAVTPDGKYVVSGSGDGTVRLWDLATGRLWNLVTGGREVRRFTGHEESVTSVAVTPDGKYVVSGSADKTVRVWYIGDLM